MTLPTPDVSAEMRAVGEYGRTRQAYGQAFKDGPLELKERYLERVQPDHDAVEAAIIAGQRLAQRNILDELIRREPEGACYESMVRLRRLRHELEAGTTPSGVR